VCESVGRWRCRSGRVIVPMGVRSSVPPHLGGCNVCASGTERGNWTSLRPYSVWAMRLGLGCIVHSRPDRG
jgi:hypothetical protein